MKNRIYQAFDEIKLDNNIRKRVYQWTGEKGLTRKYKYIYSFLCIAFAACFVIYLFPKNDSIPKDGNLEIFSTASNAPETITYDGNTYAVNKELDLSDIKMGSKVGTINQNDENIDLAEATNASDNDGYEIYSTSINGVLIVKYGDDLVMYKIQK